MAVRVVSDYVTVAAGSLYVPLGQPAGTQLALALEPDAPGSLSRQTSGQAGGEHRRDPRAFLNLLREALFEAHLTCGSKLQ